MYRTQKKRTHSVDTPVLSFVRSMKQLKEASKKSYRIAFPGTDTDVLQLGPGEYNPIYKDIAIKCQTVSSHFEQKNSPQFLSKTKSVVT